MDNDSGLKITNSQAPVPSFGCVVYFKQQSGVFTGRVANLSGIEVSADGQREMLSQIVTQFKRVVGESVANGETPEWIDPPIEKHADEQKLFLPVHL